MTESIRAIMVNHVSLEMAASPDRVWDAIREDYVEAKKFRESGVIEPLDDPVSIYGGYRMRLDHGGVVDERLVHITECDDAARRLSAMADYLSVPGGMRVFATYHAQASSAGTRFAIDCHAELSVVVAREQLSIALAEMTAGSDGHLIAYLESVKARVEAAH